jgi:lysophospholipid acyltransferase (LPLAT)-like uncharacterized protein
MMKKLRRELVILLLPFISLLLRLWARTIRWQNRYDFEKDKGKIYALWQNSLALARDGDIADGLLKRNC